MPVMDGRDATIAMREAGINTPIIAVTANVMAQDVAEYKEAGCNEFISKPIEKQSFYTMLSRYLESDTSIVAKVHSSQLSDPVQNKLNKPKKEYRGHGHGYGYGGRSAPDDGDWGVPVKEIRNQQ